VVIRGSEEIVEIVIENLLENAVSFSEAGSSITVTLSTRADTAELTIADRGPGVQAADLPRIFDRYYSSRASAPGGDEHTVHFGVGLWIVRRNIEALGGKVTAENQEPHGLVIRIVLPLKRTGRNDGPSDIGRR
jgi:two-component system sensor histidine kinase ChvG